MSCGVLPSRQNQYNRFLPRTSSPVTIATLCSAFQALNTSTFLPTNCTNAMKGREGRAFCKTPLLSA